MRIFVAVLTVGLLAGCATTKEAQVRSALTDAGLPPATAQCMAEPMARDLSTSQLRSISRVAKVARTQVGQLTQRQVLDLFKRDLDPETVGVVVRAGVGCILRG
jgi:uncharacterized lipoprotein YajG